MRNPLWFPLGKSFFFNRTPNFIFIVDSTSTEKLRQKMCLEKCRILAMGPAGSKIDQWSEVPQRLNISFRTCCFERVQETKSPGKHQIYQISLSNTFVGPTGSKSNVSERTPLCIPDSASTEKNTSEYALIQNVGYEPWNPQDRKQIIGEKELYSSLIWKTMKSYWNEKWCDFFR